MGWINRRIKKDLQNVYVEKEKKIRYIEEIKEEGKK
jgi:hypothetical protein